MSKTQKYERIIGRLEAILDLAELTLERTKADRNKEIKNKNKRKQKKERNKKNEEQKVLESIFSHQPEDSAEEEDKRNRRQFGGIPAPVEIKIMGDEKPEKPSVQNAAKPDKIKQKPVRSAKPASKKKTTTKRKVAKKIVKQPK